jgi:small subunit ribosomal protein S3
MGQKVHPGGMRVGVIHDWKSNWYTGNKDFADFLQEDVRIREHIHNKLAHAGLSDILIRKDAQRITIDIYTARPGIVIGKSGVEVDALRKDIHGMTSKAVHININEIKRPELDAKLVAQSIAEQLENRVSFRRAMKRSLASAIRSGAHGVKVMCGGRLGGGEMSRSESYSEGRVPLHTIRADIDYGFAEAKTTTGRIGVKVWINKGEIMPSGYESAAQQKDTRLGDQDQARRKGGRTEGLGASREGGRGRGADREGLGPVRQRRPRRGSGRPRERDPGRTRGETVEQPRTDEQGVSAEGREQPVVEPQVEETPAAVADAPDTTTQKTMHEDPTKLDQSGDETAEKKKASTKAASRKASTTGKPAAKKPAAKAKPAAAKKPAAKKPAAKKTTTKNDES